MAQVQQPTLTIEMEGRHQEIPASSFVAVLRSTIGILESLDANMGRGRRKRLSWSVVAASMQSPLTCTLRAASEASAGFATEVIATCQKGLEALNQGANAVPEFFDEEALEEAKRIVDVLDDDVERVAFIAGSGERAQPTRRVAASVDALLHTPVERPATIEGIVEMASVHGRNVFNLYEPIHRQRIVCHFPESLTEEVRKTWAGRALVSGVARYTATGKPISMRVIGLKRLRTQVELPQAKDLESINITGGVDPTEYVRGLRDGW